ncbi:hypothetical protein OG203_35245 [Nocardia sp. NBC_01499]|uniref:hypothetical protein n=1 Tax=Nocardia sp. NBC_01499 TaxID=2903597 RepID=UPI00386E7970
MATTVASGIDCAAGAAVNTSQSSWHGWRDQHRNHPPITESIVSADEAALFSLFAGVIAQQRIATLSSS